MMMWLVQISDVAAKDSCVFNPSEVPLGKSNPPATHKHVSNPISNTSRGAGDIFLEHEANPPFWATCAAP
jgi:hypothetical protein